MAVKYLRKYLTPSAATQTTIYTVPAANTALVSSLRITNPGSGSATINVAIFPLGGGTAYQFIEDVCDVVGYHRDPDEDEADSAEDPK